MTTDNNIYSSKDLYAVGKEYYGGTIYTIYPKTVGKHFTLSVPAGQTIKFLKKSKGFKPAFYIRLIDKCTGDIAYLKQELCADKCEGQCGEITKYTNKLGVPLYYENKTKYKQQAMLS